MVPGETCSSDVLVEVRRQPWALALTYHLIWDKISLLWFAAMYPRLAHQGAPGNSSSLPMLSPREHRAQWDLNSVLQAVLVSASLPAPPPPAQLPRWDWIGSSDAYRKGTKVAFAAQRWNTCLACTRHWVRVPDPQKKAIRNLQIPLGVWLFFYMSNSVWQRAADSMAESIPQKQR